MVATEWKKLTEFLATDGGNAARARFTNGGTLSLSDPLAVQALASSLSLPCDSAKLHHPATSRGEVLVVLGSLAGLPIECTCTIVQEDGKSVFVAEFDFVPSVDEFRRLGATGPRAQNPAFGGLMSLIQLPAPAPKVGDPKEAAAAIVKAAAKGSVDEETLVNLLDGGSVEVCAAAASCAAAVQCLPVRVTVFGA